MGVLSIVAVILIPMSISLVWSRSTYRRLIHDELFGISPRYVRSFIVSRGLYWAIFGTLLTAFCLAFLIGGANGEMTRSLLLIPRNFTSKNPILDSLSGLLAEYRFAFVAASMGTIFAALVSLFLIGAKALQRMPEDGPPGPEFLRARGRFFFLGLSLMVPPLLLSLFLAL